MATTNFHLAPPSKTVDGLLAVPIDIQAITAKLTFDAATSSAQGDATLVFTMGPADGNPIFDLRQTISAAWLDGNPLPAARLARHDFGGGTHAGLRVVESLCAAGSQHSLHVTYALGLPQASGAGSYLPALAWSAGPRLVFNFGFTDLGAGRYLEAWVPANLIFDQFTLDLELELLNTAVSHALISNGQVTILGANHWLARFGEQSTAFSPLVELRAADTLASLTDSVTLPVSGRTVVLEAWKLAGNPVDLAAQIAHLKTWLAANEVSSGPYLHGGRFVAFVHRGGMEYDGGTTSGPGALQHETFHSWWARGLKPASQPDAWFDEGWTVYNDNGANVSSPFDFTAAPVELRSPNPWVRVTASNAYADGSRFWEGAAALLGAANLAALLAEFYRGRHARPVTTADIEAFLVSRSGNAQLVDAFHRFVYGFADPAPLPDLWLQDDPAHAGSKAWAGRFWDSPDLWVRHADDGGTAHQAPEYGQDNWFYARVRNRSASGPARHFLVTFNVKAFAGLEFSYPADFLPGVAAAAGFELGPGQEKIVSAAWPRALVPPPGTHACLTAALLSRGDHPVAGKHVWEQNNLAQKNLSIVDLAPDSWVLIPVTVANLTLMATQRLLLELVRPAERPALAAGLVHPAAEAFPAGAAPEPFSLQPVAADTSAPPYLDCAGRVSDFAARRAAAFGRTIRSDDPASAAAGWGGRLEAHLPAGRTASFPITLRPQEQRVYGLRLTAPGDARPGDTIRVDLVARSSVGRRVLGGIAVEIRVH